ncbi:MAG TPA: hypothetical protein VLE89_02320 [Chlamydiales bacterium]|nr:hypothetical protein [Chlamydiales bacterium]
MKKILFLLILPFILYAQEEPSTPPAPPKPPAPTAKPVDPNVRGPWTIQNNLHESPQQIEAELDAAESQFNRAKEMFNPWYTGPLLTPSASMMPPGYGNFQPYIYMIGNYAHYDKNREAQSLPHNLYQFISQNIVQFGITDTMDIITIPLAEGQWQDDQSGGGFGDLPITLGFPMVKQSLYVPQMKFSVQETFPTGRYQNLNKNGLALSGIGGGAYQTQFSIALSKILFWTTKHPVNTRIFFSYKIPTSVHVKGFNVYGGGFGTHGKVKPGNTFSTDLGIEVSLSQPWVAALDIAYTASNATHFHGYPGVTATGAPATVGSPYNDNLSVAPGLEYNWNENLGIVFGAWFSVYGRESLAFVQGIFSVCWTFPVD